MRLLLLQMELCLTGLLLYLGAFHLKQRNSLSTVEDFFQTGIHFNTP